MSTPTAPGTTDLTHSPSADAVLIAARQLLATLIEHPRDEIEQARAEVALAHLDDVWPLPSPAVPADVDARGAVLLDEAMSALVTVVATAVDAQARARGFRALELLTSNLDLPGEAPLALRSGPMSGQP